MTVRGWAAPAYQPEPQARIIPYDMQGQDVPETFLYHLHLLISVLRTRGGVICLDWPVGRDSGESIPIRPEPQTATLVHASGY